jgi:hypothetical protein
MSARGGGVVSGKTDVLAIQRREASVMPVKQFVDVLDARSAYR